MTLTRSSGKVRAVADWILIYSHSLREASTWTLTRSRSQEEYAIEQEHISVRGVERQDSEESERRGEANSERAKEEGES